MANDNDILIITSSPKPEGVKDSIEKKSGDVPSRVKLTKLTNETLRRNIELAKIEGIAATLNKELIEIKKAIEQVETEKAEAEIRKQIIAPVESQPLDQEQLEHMKLIATVSAAAAPSRLLPIFDMSSLELANINETFYNGQKLVATTVSGYVPKAIITPKFLAVLCSDINNKKMLYKHADMVKDPMAKSSEQPRIANWRLLFEADEKTSSVDEERIDERRQENDFAGEVDSVVTEDELKKRTLIANIGDELDRIAFLLDGIGGNTPFNTDLKEKKSRLLSMLTELTGASVEITKIKKDDLRVSKTEFQTLIDKIVGYTPPITPEEHEEKESELEHYYSDPHVQEKLEELRLKDILATVNDPEFASKIDEAERKHNEDMAARSVAVETLDSTDVVEEKKSDDTDIKSMTEEVAQEQYENVTLRSMAEAAAQEIYEETALRSMAEVAAQEIFEDTILRPMAEDTAQKIFEDTILRPMAEDTAQEIFEDTTLRSMAEDTAQEIFEDTTLRSMAEKAAREIYENTALRSMAEDTAQEIHNGTVNNETVNNETVNNEVIHDDVVINDNLIVQKIQEEKTAELQEAAMLQGRMLLSSPTNNSGFEVSTSEIGRYGVYVAPSKPIRINTQQLRTLRNKGQQHSNNIAVNSKQKLVSLKEQLDQLDLGVDRDEDSPVISKAL